MSYGERLKSARKSRGMTIEQLALEIGTNTRTLARIESGEHEPRITTYRKITDYLGEI